MSDEETDSAASEEELTKRFHFAMVDPMALTENEFVDYALTSCPNLKNTEAVKFRTPSSVNKGDFRKKILHLILAQYNHLDLGDK